MTNLTTMTYGSYNFSPVPFINMSQDTISNRDGRIGTRYNITLEGTLSTAPGMAGGIVNVDTLQDNLRAAFAQDGLKFELKCSSTPMLICYPKLSGPITFPPSNNNWVYTCPYTIELEFEDFAGEDHKPYVDQASENWTVEFVEDSSKYCLELSGVTATGSGYYYDKDCNYIMMRVSHNLSAVGQQHYVDSGTGYSSTGILNKAAWEYARDWCIPRLGLDSGVLQDSGILNLNITGYGAYNHMRGTSRSETQGSYAVDESWLVTLSGSGDTYTGNLRATEDFEISVVEEAESDITQCSINGTIQGWESRNYGTSPGDFVITETKIQAAEAYYATILPRLYPRCQLYSQSTTARNLNIIPLAKTIGYAPSRGTVTYNISYDDRPGVRFISGAIAETISMDHGLASDVFASLAVIGRISGPVLQSVNTYTSPVLTFNIEATMPSSTGTGLAGFMDGIPRSQVNSFLCQVQADLTGHYSQVFVTENRESWTPPKYNRSITYLYGLCGTGSIFSGVC
jgi:hypothetical protein